MRGRVRHTTGVTSAQQGYHDSKIGPRLHDLKNPQILLMPQSNGGDLHLPSSCKHYPLINLQIRLWQKLIPKNFINTIHTNTLWNLQQSTEIMASSTAVQQSDNIAHALSGAGGGLLSMALTSVFTNIFHFDYKTNRDAVQLSSNNPLHSGPGGIEPSLDHLPRISPSHSRP